MNSKIDCNTNYVTPNRTFETITIDGSNRFLYVYNYKGVHFRLFTEIFELAQFLELGKEPKYDFLNEADLDLFLEEFSTNLTS